MTPNLDTSSGANLVYGAIARWFRLDYDPIPGGSTRCEPKEPIVLVLCINTVGTDVQ